MITPREARLLLIVRKLAAPKPHAMSPGKIHKAMSAESILRHCLKVKGWATAYRRGELTGRQHLQLLEEIRLYARAWLRHEATSFANVQIRRDGDGRRSLRGSAVARADPPASTETVINLPDPGFRAGLRRFFGRVKQFVRESIVAGVMSLLGPAPLTGEELEQAEVHAVVQDQYFDRFHREILDTGIKVTQTEMPIVPGAVHVIQVEPAGMTPGQFIARAESYGNAAWQAAQKVSHESAKKIFKFEARFLGEPKTSHCDDCPPLSVGVTGWVPVGTLPPIGDTECGQQCLCSFRYRETPDGPDYFRGRRGPVPAPPHPKGKPLPETDEDEIVMIAEPPGVHINAPIAGPPTK